MIAYDRPAFKSRWGTLDDSRQVAVAAESVVGETRR